MLLAIKDKIKGVLGMVVIAIIAVPFTLWGIQSYLGDDVQLYAAKVNDIEISTQEFNRALSNQRRQIQQRNKDKVQIDDLKLKKEVLEQLIRQKLLIDVSIENGYSISDQVVLATIKNNTNFSIDGVFDRELYDNILAANGMTSPGYESSLKTELQIKQLQNSIMMSSFATKQEIKNQSNLDFQKREFSYIIYDNSNTSSVIDVSDEDVSRYYAENPTQFMSEEKIKIEYIEVLAEDFTSAIDIDETKIQALYESYVADINSSEERRASHILLTLDDGEDKDTVKDRLIALKKEIDKGASFAEMAKKYSEDPASADQGGDLDWLGREQMIAAFDEALFAMNEGEVSDVVETQFGFHLIKLDKIRSEKIQTLAEKRDELIAELQADSVDGMFYDVTDNLAAAAYENSDNLGVVSEIVNIKVKSSDFFTRTQGMGIAQHDVVREAAYSETVLENARNSDVIEITPEHIAVVRVVDHVPAEVKPLSAVKSEIVKRIEENYRRDVVSAAANAAKDKIMAGSSLKDIATKSLVINKSGLVGRRDIEKADFNLLQAAFKMKQPTEKNKSVDVVRTLSGAMAVVVLDKVEFPTDLDEKKIAETKRNLMTDAAVLEFNAYVDSKMQAASIYRNNKVLEQDN